MDIAYDKTNNKYIIGEDVIMSKEDFLEYVQSDMLRNAVSEREATINIISKELDESSRVNCGYNIMIYGVPGCGKSYIVQNQYCKNFDFVQRVVFHPDYSYGDFVGQILPKINNETKSVSYEFSPGPFSEILSYAYSNPTKRCLLVIEEINRGNAPAIFGDIFQLLDRDKKGNSIYPIYNTNISNLVYGNSKHRLIIHSNLCIIGTMNTCDQNIFTLDTAFQRRWRMKLIENDINKAPVIASKKILDSDITWGVFNTKINQEILSKNSGLISTEDKRLGVFFVSESDLEIKEQGQEKLFGKNSFAEKVLKYLWDDAFKYSRTEIFNSEYNTLESIIKTFEDEKGNRRFKIFVDGIFNLDN